MARRRFNGSLDLLQLALVSHRLAGLDPHVKAERLVTWRADFDPMRPCLDMQLLEDAVEVVDDADVIPVDVDRRLFWFDLEPESSFVLWRGVVLRVVPSSTVPRIVEGVVV